MIKYAKIINQETGLCEVGTGTNTEFYKSIEMIELDVEQSDIDGNWYLKELCPKKSDEQKLQEAKDTKYNEALQKAYSFQQEGTVEYKNCVFEMSDSNRKNLSDTEEALKLMGEDSTVWNDKDDNLVTLTIEDIQYIRLNLILARIQKLWIEQYPAYKAQVEGASTIEEVESIMIDYSILPNVPEE